MIEINENTLIMAIQAVSDAVHDLSDEVTLTDGDDLPDMQELLLAYSKAAGDLKKAYETLAATGTELPPYGELTARRGS